MTTQTWNSDGYVRNARFVTDLGIPVLELLVARLGEHILFPGITDDFSLVASIGVGGDRLVGFEVQVQDSEITNTLAGSTGGLGE
jgi:hypothetical protein